MSDRTTAKIRAKQAMRGMTIALWASTFLVALPVAVVSAVGSTAESVAVTVFSVGKDSLIVSVISAIFSLLTIAAAILTIPLKVSLCGKYLHVARGGLSSERSILDAYRNKKIVEPIKAHIIAGIYIAIGYILCIIPGIVLSLRYSMLSFIFADEPDIDYRTAMSKCKELTKGRTGKIFVFYLSYIGWYVLTGLTCGILSLYVTPYENTAFAALYDIWNPKQEETLTDDQTPPEPSDYPTFDVDVNNDQRIIF